jgi:regulator of sigma D
MQRIIIVIVSFKQLHQFTGNFYNFIKNQHFHLYNKNLNSFECKSLTKKMQLIILIINLHNFETSILFY